MNEVTNNISNTLLHRDLRPSDFLHGDPFFTAARADS